MEIVRAVAGDGADIIAVQRAAFASQAALYGVPDLPPMVETPESAERDISDDVVLRAVEDGRTVGSVRGKRLAGEVYVGRLAVAPESQGRGIGRALLEAIEAAFPEALAFELMTGSLSAPQLALYTSLGYVESRREKVAPGIDVELVYLRKEKDPTP